MSYFAGCGVRWASPLVVWVGKRLLKHSAAEESPRGCGAVLPPLGAKISFESNAGYVVGVAPGVLASDSGMLPGEGLCFEEGVFGVFKLVAYSGKVDDGDEGKEAEAYEYRDVHVSYKEHGDEGGDYAEQTHGCGG